MASNRDLLENLRDIKKVRGGTTGQQTHEPYLIACPLITVPQVGTPVVHLGHNPVRHENIGHKDRV